MTQITYHTIDVGLSGTGLETSTWKQTLFLGHETEAIVRRIWLGIIANGDRESYIKVTGSDGVVEWSCTSTKNPSIDNIQLPKPFTED